MSAAENYKTLRAKFDTPEKAAIAYRDFAKVAVRYSVMGLKAFDRDTVLQMAAAAEVPQEDREPVVDYVGAQYRGLHEGNTIRVKLKPEDLAAIEREKIGD